MAEEKKQEIAKTDDKSLSSIDPTEIDNTKQKVARFGLNAAGSIPGVGGVFSAISSAWSEKEQEEVNRFFKHWLQMLADEIREKENTIVEIMMRIDLQDEEIAKRVKGSEFQSLMKKAFRDWAAAESEEKRILIRNILANAAVTQITSDDVINLFLDWLKQYSVLHFQVIKEIYNSGGISRAEMWERLGKPDVREDSAEADLFKLLIRDLSTGGVIRQHVERDYDGRAILKKPKRSGGRSAGAKVAKSAFDDQEEYELTQLGDQFVHYAMTDLPLKIEAPDTSETEDEKDS